MAAVEWRSKICSAAMPAPFIVASYTAFSRWCSIGARRCISLPGSWCCGVSFALACLRASAASRLPQETIVAVAIPAGTNGAPQSPCILPPAPAPAPAPFLSHTPGHDRRRCWLHTHALHTSFTRPSHAFCRCVHATCIGPNRLALVGQ
jgi:hypothetical protein